MLMKMNGTEVSTGKELGDVKRVTRKMSALIRYATASKDMELVTKAVDAKLEAEREGGLALIAMAKNGQRQRGGRPKQSHAATVLSLDDMGITKSDSSRWQSLARMDKVEFSRRKHWAVHRAWSAWERVKQEADVSHEMDDGDDSEVGACNTKIKCPSCGERLVHRKG